MRLLADENIASHTVAELRRRSHDVAIPRRAMTDAAIMTKAVRERRVLLTQDTDFGEMVFAQGARVPGVILVRLPITTPVSTASAVADAIDARTDWNGHFSVIEARRVRQRTLRPAR